MSLIKLALESYDLPIFGSEVIPTQKPNLTGDRNRSRNNKGLMTDRTMKAPSSNDIS